MRVLETMIEGAVGLGKMEDTVARIKHDLGDAIRGGLIQLDGRFHQTTGDHYARRLLCRNPELGYTAVVMTWGPGQGTAVHDHAGMWCVEGVVHGNMQVTQYDLEEQRGDLYRFSQKGVIQAGVGSSGCLIPPYEYHVLANPTDSLAITLHVYGGEMVSCHVYHPRTDGWHERRYRELAYDV